MELERLRASALNGSTNALEELHALAEKNTITFPAVWPVIAKLIEPYGLSELKRRKACSTSEPRIQQILACLNLLSALLIHPDGLVKLHPPIPLDARVTLWKCLEPWVAFLAQATVNAKPTLLNHAGSAFVDAVILPLEAFFLAVAQHPDCLGTQAWDLERRIKFSAPLCVIWRRCMASDHLYRPYALSRALSRLFWVGIQSPHTLASIAFDVNNPTEGESAMLHHAERFGVNEEGECSWPSVHSFLQLLAVFETTYGSVWLERRAEQVRALTIMLRVFGSRRAKMVLNAGPSGRSLLAVHGIMEKIFVSLNLRSGGTVYEALKAEILVSLANLHYQTQSIRPAPGEEAECWRDVRSTAAETLKTIKPMLFWPSMRSLALTYIKAIEAGGVENKLEKTTEYWKEWQAFKKVADELKEGDGAIRQVFHSCSYHECPTPKPIPKPVKSCTGCHQAGYCSSECQRADWRKIHSKMCKRLIVNTNDKMYSKPDAVYLLRRAALDYHARKARLFP
ncbi:hypothetical protein CYLTODRAFT_221676 [Cylindrobasidium torrendii FP15055 ss-10]|uniref:MYND-type domain-containing protein n=1 Tax=Cylindrobasidium torrendii FP15055 ss-10 TaxID=1314674 RepID=A0A0D7BGH9_9AGAR|nr:hypothetical protein CYLTODRAFT_221676 [Cylindrobasidium torrendii FP15055 ss-10]